MQELRRGWHFAQAKAIACMQVLTLGGDRSLPLIWLRWSRRSEPPRWPSASLLSLSLTLSLSRYS